MNLDWQPLELDLAHPFRLSRGVSTRRTNLVVRLRRGGETGFGEAAMVPYYENHNLAEAESFLERLGLRLADQDFFDLQGLDALFRVLDPRERHGNLRAAVEAACLDMVGRALGLPLWRLFGLDPARTPPTSFTIAIDTPAACAERAAAATSFSCLKLKVGGLEDLAILEAVRRVRPEATLRVDANGGLDFDQALALARAMEELGGVELFEEPLRQGGAGALGRLRERTSLPIYADESVQRAADLAALAGQVDGVNLKGAKLGGPTRTRAAIETARALGLEVMLGCMVESSLGTAALAHLAPLADRVDLDGPLLLARDPYAGLLYRGERVELPRAPGIGVHRR